MSLYLVPSLPDDEDHVRHRYGHPSETPPSMVLLAASVLCALAARHEQDNVRCAGEIVGAYLSEPWHPSKGAPA